MEHVIISLIYGTCLWGAIAFIFAVNEQVRFLRKLRTLPADVAAVGIELFMKISVIKHFWLIFTFRKPVAWLPMEMEKLTVAKQNELASSKREREKVNEQS